MRRAAWCLVLLVFTLVGSSGVAVGPAPELIAEDPVPDALTLLLQTVSLPIPEVPSALPEEQPVPAVPETPLAETPEPTPPKRITISFDDGPRASTTPLLLDILKEFNAKATFFVVGENAERQPSILRRMLEEGHTIGNHTYSHPRMLKLSDEERRREVTKTTGIIQAATGYTPMLFRPPYGQFPKDEAFFEGCEVVYWSADSRDWSFRDPEKTVAYTLPQIAEGKCILMHDIYPETIEAARILLKTLTEEGYVFVTLEELLGSR